MPLIARLSADRLRASGLITLVGVIVMLPLLLGPPHTNDSHWINIVWADQFTAELARGHIWPRWLPASHDGLGAPVFYFYGPGAFWVAGLFGLAGTGVWLSLALAATAMLVGSGIAMYLYLVGRADRPLAGALVYMLAPYHLLDFAQRGALAEFAAYAWLPLIAIGVTRAVAGQPLMLALAYAGLALTHLPTTMLATFFLLPLLGALEAKAAPAAWARIAAGIGGGIALAAPYWLPALTLQGATAMETMRSLAIYQPWNWSILKLSLHDAPGVLLIHAIAVAALLFALSVAAKRREAAPWQAFAILTALLALGALPPLWRVPGLDHVQFPWRILQLSEFALALLVAHISPPSWRVWAAGVPLAGLSLLLATPAATQPSGTFAELLRHHPDVIEYLPHGVGEPIGIHSSWALRLARTTQFETFDGTRTTVRRFAFPAWQVRCGDRLVEAGPQPTTGLLRYRGRGCTIEQAMPISGRIGWGIALTAIALALWRRLCSIAPRQRLAISVAR